MKIIIEFFLPFNKNPAVHITLEKLNDKIFGNINRSFKTNIHLESNDESYSSFFVMTINFEEDFKVVDMIKIINFAIEEICKNFTDLESKDFLYTIKKQD